MIKIIAGYLFALENGTIILNKINPEIEKFINYPYKNGGLKYDIQNKIGKAVLREIESIINFRNTVVSEKSSSNENEENDSGKKLIELLNSEIELECSPVSLRKLSDENCSGLQFNILDKFILDDRE